ncbi:cytochrome P450 [Skermanella mucosa]|uniref:cytochrome P450 n=1 Tax=Skermanella mucosa TaxID=1789672 RepID=UPI00192B0737|nr:cytochrome P450 [Skermanella mucosa]UEM22167.1 cytochrome P450 [Skermanella mucosa]
MSADIAAKPGPLPRASLRDTLAAVAEIVLPTISKGVIIRRPKVVGLAERLGLDGRAVRRMQRLRAKYGPGPLMLAIPGRHQAIILSPEDVHTVLDNAPEPFSPASAEKRAALAHLEPHASLISRGPKRADRRRFNEQVLDSGCPVHRMGERFVAVVGEEAEGLLKTARSRGELAWDDFTASWHNMVRRVVLGDAARDDEELTDMLARLRAAGNWAFLRPQRKGLRDRFYERLEGHLARAEPGSLAAVIAATPRTADTAPAHQVAHWFFAFDPGGMATFRALALLASHPDQADRARREIGDAGTEGRRDLPFLRACILESLRLWPTTPAVLRETTRETQWDTGTMPKNTSVFIFAPFFHRDDENLPYADRFTPDLWMDGVRQGGWPLIPFSGGPAICPARDLVPMLGGAMLAALLDGRRVRLKEPGRIDPGARLPGTLDNYTLRFDLGG